MLEFIELSRAMELGNVALPYRLSANYLQRRSSTTLDSSAQQLAANQFVWIDRIGIVGLMNLAQRAKVRRQGSA